MEEKARQIRMIIDTVCGAYHIYKDEKVIEKAQKAVKDIQEFCIYFLQGNIFGMESEDYEKFVQYVMQVLEDFITALQQQDMVLMLDTLDFGLRELVNIYID